MTPVTAILEKKKENHNMFDNNDVSYDDVVKLLFEIKKDQHASRVLRMVEEIKLLQGKLEAQYEATNINLPQPPATPNNKLESK